MAGVKGGGVWVWAGLVAGVGGVCEDLAFPPNHVSPSPDIGVEKGLAVQDGSFCGWLIPLVLISSLFVSLLATLFVLRRREFAQLAAAAERAEERRRWKEVEEKAKKTKTPWFKAPKSGPGHVSQDENTASTQVQKSVGKESREAGSEATEKDGTKGSAPPSIHSSAESPPGSPPDSRPGSPPESPPGSAPHSLADS